MQYLTPLLNKKEAHTGFAIALAWPETRCKQAGAWYDPLLYYLKINREGYYQVGHAAVILVQAESGNCHYYDFGRYHAPQGYGRVRNEETDYDLRIQTTAKIRSDGREIANLDEILSELSANPSTHGSGPVFAVALRIRFEAAMAFASQLQAREFVSYGPFVLAGSNCSRFVSKVMQAGKPDGLTQLRLRLPRTLSPTPMGNLWATGKRPVSFPTIKSQRERKPVNRRVHAPEILSVP